MVHPVLVLRRKVLRSPNLLNLYIMTTLINHLKSIGATSCSKVVGPNGAFISYITPQGKGSLPIGKKSQEGSLSDYNILIAEDSGQAIATVNNYEEVESLAL